MTSSPSRCERLKRAVSPRLPERYRRDDSGLTTLEWLLIVAAVAGLAALAVVLVTNVVRDTSDQIAGRSARLTAAEVSAQSIEDDAELDEAEKKKHCERLPIGFTDVGDKGIDAVWDSTAKTCTVTPKT